MAEAGGTEAAGGRAEEWVRKVKGECRRARAGAHLGQTDKRPRHNAQSECAPGQTHTHTQCSAGGEVMANTKASLKRERKQAAERGCDPAGRARWRGCVPDSTHLGTRVCETYYDMKRGEEGVW